MGYLDWATQPDPFRRYPGARMILLPRQEDAAAVVEVDTAGGAAKMDNRSVGWFLRYAMGLSAWKAYGQSRWALRVNPSSGNLHPTEAYIVHEGHILHYAPREHAVEERAVLPFDAWRAYAGDREGMLVGLTSIHWREAWKYGERAFRYCQHDIGHAIGALRVSAALFGWTFRLLSDWSDEQIASLLGVDRDADRGGAEPEHPGCIALVAPSSWEPADPAPVVAAAREAAWYGRASLLSPGHVDWPIIDRVARASAYETPVSRLPAFESHSFTPRVGLGQFPRNLILQRRSAVAFDGRSSLARDRFFAILSALTPGAPPFDAIDWPAQVHLAIFVHRVEGLVPGLYAWLRETDVVEEWRSAMRPEFLWEAVDPGTTEDAGGGGQLFLLLPADVTWVANRVSCDQAIAGDGFLSLGMIARVESALRHRGEWFYRRLFWECGLIGQVLYLAAEAAGGRGTGIGCFYDDAVHEILGLSGREWQSLYHFSMGVPVEDARLTTEPGYPWEVPVTGAP